MSQMNLSSKVAAPEGSAPPVPWMFLGLYASMMNECNMLPWDIVHYCSPGADWQDAWLTLALLAFVAPARCGLVAGVVALPRKVSSDLRMTSIMGRGTLRHNAVLCTSGRTTPYHTFHFPLAPLARSLHRTSFIRGLLSPLCLLPSVETSLRRNKVPGPKYGPG